MTISQTIKRAVPPLIGCAIIAVMLWKIGLSELKASLANADPYLLVAVFFIFATTIFIFRAIRWIIMFPKARPLEATKVMLVGLAINQIAPIGTGDLARVYMARRSLNIAIGETLAPVVVERILDTTFLLIASLQFLFSLATGNGYVWQIIVPLVLIFAGYGLLFNARFLDKLEQLLEKIKQIRLFSRMLGRFSGSLSLGTFKSAMLGLRGRRVMLLSVLLTIATWVIGAVAEYLLLLAVGVEISILDLFSVYFVSWLVGTFSFLPGGLGAKEVSFAFLLNATAGVPLTIGMEVSLMERLMVYVLLGGGAFASLLSFSRSRGKR